MQPLMPIKKKRKLFLRMLLSSNTTDTCHTLFKGWDLQSESIFIMNHVLCISTFFFCQSCILLLKNPELFCLIFTVIFGILLFVILIFVFLKMTSTDRYQRCKPMKAFVSFSVVGYSDRSGELLDCCIGCVF